MKDRWKILIISLIIAAVLSALFLFLGSSFKQVGLRQYGVLQYSFYGTVDATQTVRTSGNYLVGLDHTFIPYPRRILEHEFTVTTLTKDKSMISMQGLLLAELIESQIINMHFNYADQYFKLAGKAAQQAFRQSLQLFLLTQIISSRTSVNSYISSNVCLSVESRYSFIDCRYVSTGNINVNAVPVVLTPENSVQIYLKNLLEKTIQTQKKMNIYGNGGFDLIQKVQNLNSQLFFNSSKLVVETVSNYTTDGTQVFAGAAYVISNPLIPLLNNTISSISLSDS